MRWTSKCDGIKRNEIVPFKETWMNLETVIQSEENQKKKNKYHIISLICGIKKKWYRWTYLLSKNTDTEVENKLMETKRERWSEMNWKIGIDTYALCMELITNENLLQSTRNQGAPLSALWGPEGNETPNRGHVFARATDSLCCAAEINTTL